MKMVNSVFRDRMAKVACSLCNVEGGVSLGGGRKLHTSVARRFLESEKIDFEGVGGMVSALRDLEAVSDVFDDEELSSKLVFYASNGGVDKVSKTFGLSVKAAAAVCGAMEANGYNLQKSKAAVFGVLGNEVRPVEILSREFSTDDVEFAAMFAYSRMWRSFKVPENIKMLRAACSKFVQMSKEASDDSAYDELENFMAKGGAARRSASSASPKTSLQTNLNNECCKAFFSEGLVVHPAFVSWIEEAICAAHIWATHQPTLNLAALSMLDNVFLLSCVDRMEPKKIESVLTKFEEGIAQFNCSMLPPGMGMLWLHRKSGEPDEVLYRMFKRINLICGRNKR
jgi:hypothetical protein